ncbi:hypothetical protein WA1_08120 [Scytonema hofmannii PCC 7110]|uniref:YtkA-like domain-containing protein n=1 Tax=Scytonema hofmannii PCC 7110 TaxID=128403 RepID=A0A139WTM0_9CYAN|nr:hypothetical protein [Scytonema hofmannii]KYC35757.1 hypothetical protein WA1_08120 [Scytonema hofmannii PCC 7110]
MKSLKSKLIIVGTIGTFFLGACSNSNQAANSESSTAQSQTSTTSTSQPSVPTASPAAAKKTEHQHGESHGGTIVETGAYHLEFVPLKEANRTHLDFYLQKGENHEAIPNAKVTALVQLPDGTQKTIPLTYDAGGKHYKGMLAEKATGQYQVRVTSDINGKKVDGRFTFNK